ncbi:MAG: leucine-rich repeat domain-containing protein [Ignavibacteria bacterium]|jgi:Leucine-rich repeat (LRR) protein|nr:leucine-rich repeat domain-containing protein [Ignavibacteria bacterium]MCU7505213.1 leucine-rich repeat domain-containing protein [Ignavibacteria bacterium]MCU7517293.1 leucine-rich repeat domain-containing protein [Ignavibacteria bacterium]
MMKKILFSFLWISSSVYSYDNHDTIRITEKEHLKDMALIVQQHLTAEALYLNVLSLDSIPFETGKLKFLNRIEVCCNNIRRLPHFFSDFTHLEVINLGNNLKLDLKSSFMLLSKCYGLKEIQLYSSDIKIVPDEISLLTSIVKLNLSNNIIKVLPEGMSKLSNLEELNISSNPINIYSILSTIKLLPRLKKLNIYNCKLTVIPDSLESLGNLEELILTGNKIKSLPESISYLSKLKTLIIADNQIEDIPLSIIKLKELKVLLLGGYKIDENKLNYIKKKMPWCNIIGNKI